MGGGWGIPHKGGWGDRSNAGRGAACVWSSPRRLIGHHYVICYMVMGAILTLGRGVVLCSAIRVNRG